MHPDKNKCRYNSVDEMIKETGSTVVLHQRDFLLLYLPFMFELAHIYFSRRNKMRYLGVFAFVSFAECVYWLLEIPYWERLSVF